MTKRQGVAEATAARQSTKEGQKVTREKTRTRAEVRKDTIAQKQNPKNDGGGR